MEARTQKGADTKRGFVLSVAQIFSRDGFNNCGIERICEEAHMPVGSFYRYFSNKEDLLNEIVDLLRANLTEKLKDIPPGGAAIEAMFRLFFEFVDENKAFYQALREVEFVQEQVSRSFYDSYANLIGSKLPPDLDPESREIAAFGIIGIQSFFAMKWLLWDGKSISPEVIRDLSTIATAGIAGNREFNFTAAIQDAQILLGKKEHKPRFKDHQDKLLLACEKVFGSSNFKKASVSEICRLAGVSTGTFYNLFKSKEDAYRQTIISLRNTLVELVKTVTSGTVGQLEVELRCFLAFLDFIRRHPYGYKIMREAEFVELPLARDYYDFLFENYSRHMQEAAGSDIFSVSAPETVALAIMGMGHIFGLKYEIWAKEKLAGLRLHRIVRHMFLGSAKSHDTPTAHYPATSLAGEEGLASRDLLCTARVAEASGQPKRGATYRE